MNNDFLAFLHSQERFVVECNTTEETHAVIDLCLASSTRSIINLPLIRNSNEIAHFRFEEGEVKGWNKPDVGYRQGWGIDVFLPGVDFLTPEEDDFNMKVSDIL